MYKIEKSAKKTERKCDIVSFVLLKKHILLICLLNTISSVHAAKAIARSEFFYLKSVLYAQLTAHCTIQNTDCPHGARKDTQLAQ